MRRFAIPDESSAPPYLADAVSAPLHLADVLPAPLLARFSELLAARLGLHFPPERWGDLVRALAAMAPEFGCGDPCACLGRLLAAPLDARELEILAAHLTVGESYFFRDPAAFDCLEREILPGLLRQRGKNPAGARRLRLWSAGCSSGEEAYSLAIVLDRALPDPAAWQVDILATDINTRALARAALGVYDAWSFRGVPPELKERYFRRTADGRFAVLPALRSRVRFARLNLAEDPFPAAETDSQGMDVVFCRNVLMYFAPARARAVLEKLGRCLVEGGFLLLSPVETSLVALPQLRPRYLPDLVLFRKETAPLPPPQAVRPALPAPPRLPPAGGGKAAVRSPRPRAGEGDRSPAAAQPDGSPRPRAGEGSEERAGGPNAYGGKPLPAETAGRARALADRGRLAEALACCDRAIAADRLDPARTYLRASILLEQGRTEAAAAALRRTLYLDHGHCLAHFALGNLHAGRGHAGEARRHYRNALSSLDGRPPGVLVPESGGITAGRLRQTLRDLLGAKA